jgi:hypothetical protein
VSREAEAYLLVKCAVLYLGFPLEELLDLVKRMAAHVEAFITDTFDPKAGACGTTGKFL